MANFSQIKSKDRVAAHGEVFTAEREVKAMCDLVADECNRIESRFLEPACGDGNFLAEVLRRKLAVAKSRYGKPLLHHDFERASVNAVMSIYGVELLEDNARICRKRLFSIWNEVYTEVCASDATDKCRESVKFILSKNILCGDALSMRQGKGRKEDAPIIFAEWSFIGSVQVKRRDFRLDKLIEVNERAKMRQFSLPTCENGVVFDNKNQEFIPVPVKEYPPTDYRMLYQYG